MFSLGFYFVYLVFLFPDHLLISFLQVLDSLLQEFVFFKKFFVFLLLALYWLGLFGQFRIFFLKLGQLNLADVSAFDFDDFVIFFPFPFNLLFEGLDFSFQIGDLKFVVILVVFILFLLRFLFVFGLFKFFPQLPDSFVELKGMFF